MRMAKMIHMPLSLWEQHCRDVYQLRPSLVIFQMVNPHKDLEVEDQGRLVSMQAW
jgi:hypothetical protein